MTADDPGPPRATSPPRLERPDGGWQVGVGPGAVVLRSTSEGAGTAAGRALGPALAGLVGADPGVDAPVERDIPACPVLGAGPLAGRLRRLLGDTPTGVAARVQVVVHQHVVPPDVGLTVARSGRCTVPVVAQHRRVLVGPVVGVMSAPCLHCLDLHRRDRDPAWPALATALGHPAEQVQPLDVAEPLARAAEGLVLLLVSSVLAGGTVSAGLGYELGPAAPHVVVRRWTTHPGCPWHAGDEAGALP